MPAQVKNKDVIAMGSPRSIKLSMLNGNNFFTLDYEPIHQTQFNAEVQLSDTHAYNPSNTMYIERKAQLKKNGFMIKSVVKSAQYSRNLHAISTQKNRTSLNLYSPYSRIKKVDQKIQEFKKLSAHNQSWKLQQNNQKVLQYSPKLAFKALQQKQPRKRHIKALSFVVQSQRTENRIDFSPRNTAMEENYFKKSLQPSKKFTQNYKNRRKLTDRIANRKNNAGGDNLRSVSPLQWRDTQIVNNSNHSPQSSNKPWDPQSGKLLINHNPQLLRSLQGNKIKYSNKNNHHKHISKTTQQAQLNNIVNFQRYNNEHGKLASNKLQSIPTFAGDNQSLTIVSSRMNNHSNSNNIKQGSVHKYHNNNLLPLDANVDVEQQKIIQGIEIYKIGGVAI